MTDQKHSPKCDTCRGTGKREATTGDTDKFASVCPFCAGTGQTLKLDTGAVAALSFGVKRR